MHGSIISVIIPVYNTAEYLPRCLDSILNNTYRELEVICVNDGSKDNSLEVLNDYAVKDSRVKVIDQPNAGVSVARNHGLDEATGEYIAFVDSDDWVHHRYFEILLSCMQASGADIQICAENIVSDLQEDLEISPNLPENTLLSELQTLENGLNVWKRLYKRKVIRNIRFIKGMRFAEDRVFNMEVYCRTAEIRVMFIQTPMYYYYMRNDSAVHALHPREVKPLVLWYKDHLQDVSRGEIYRYYLIDAAKKLLSWRYSILYFEEAGERELVRELMQFFCAKLMESGFIDKRTKLIYAALIKAPNLYRMFRIVSDPTMLGWEKLQREKARAEKNKK